MATKIQFRRGTAAEWTAADPTLSIGELGLETDTRLFKIGDGVTAWTSLGYMAATLTRNYATDATYSYAGYAYGQSASESASIWTITRIHRTTLVTGVATGVKWDDRETEVYT